ncbi:hypothetical protein DHD80_00775 [Gramella sp. AN32]|nr:hypothetical protein [Gramella sp. AN32]
MFEVQSRTPEFQTVCLQRQ